MRELKRIAVYCGSSAGASAEFADAAAEFGSEMARQGIDLVWGGGRVGLMGIVADAVIAGGGQAIGVITRQLRDLELEHGGCSELYVVESMHARKLMMAQLADAFVALPGGYGTLDELFEVTTWTQLNLHHKPVGLLNTSRFYDHLLAHVNHAVQSGFVRGVHADLIASEETSASLIEVLRGAEVPDLASWISKV